MRGLKEKRKSINAKPRSDKIDPNLTPEIRVGPPSAEMEELYARDAGRGISPYILDRAPWLEDDFELGRWLDALVTYDKRRDLTPLMNQLESCVPPKVYPHLKDFFNRYELKRKRGKPPTPSYDRTPAETKLYLAVERIRENREDGMSQDDAISDAARAYHLSEETLRNAYGGRRGSTRRMIRRRQGSR